LPVDGRGRTTGERQRVAVVCYSYGLAHHLKRSLLVGSSAKRPAFVGTFEDLARSWGIDVSGTRDDSNYWEVQLPALMAERALALEEKDRFDSVIVDEAQDFADEWWTPLVRALRDEETGGLFAYSDERQRVFARFGHPPLALVPLVLDHNLRNTRQIARSFVPLAPTSMLLRGTDGPEVEFVPTSVSDAVEVADAWVERLLDEGWQPQDVALLTTGARHPVQKERQEAAGFAAYWELLVERRCLLLSCPGLQGHGAPCRRAVSERRRKSRALPGASLRRAVPGDRSAGRRG
jgi:hypothetical protein